MKMAVIACLVYVTHCDQCITYIAPLNPQEPGKVHLISPIYKRKLRPSGCSLLGQRQTLLSEGQVSAEGKVQCEVAGMS